MPVNLLEPPEELRPILARYAGRGRTALLEALWDVQGLYGYVTPEAARAIAQALHVPLSDVHGVVEFYSMFYREPVGRTIIRICEDVPCLLAGSNRILEAASRRLGIAPGETTSDGAFTLEACSCLGQCHRAPAALVNTTAHGHLAPDSIESLLANRPALHRPRVGGYIRVALANVGLIDPTSLDDYLTQGGFAALRRALTQMTPAQVIADVKASGLVGRGGAAFPTGVKWESAARARGEARYVICNADESEPGAFKDRVLLEGDPFRVLEGLLICGYAIGARRGFVYVRGEYPLAHRLLLNAVEEARAAGFLGEHILGSDFGFDVEVRRGAGAYICGEETALMESIEGKRGMPRLRPPYPTTFGLWGQPTVINNVETFAKVPPIILHGGAWYRSLGTADSAGTKLFAVSGHVVRPGVYEVPFGITLRHLLFDLAGGVPGNRPIQAVLTGGAAGTFLTSEQLDAILDFKGIQAAGGTVGAGTIMVFDDTVDMRMVLARIARFFAHESCGKCYPCQLGTQRQAEILERIAQGDVRRGDVALLQDVGWTMADTSICGLGQTAATALLSALKRWPDLIPQR
jgi:NADH-quinone oxidoreductase subunit F